MMWELIDTFTRGRLLNFVCLVRKGGGLPKQDSHLYKHGKEKQEENP